MSSLRILSLLPAATEIIYLLGLERNLVGVSDDCDFPPQVKKVSKITSSSISNAMSSLEIDMAVKKLGHRGNGVFHINQKRLKELKPNLILTQDICPVCAVSYTEVKKAARILDSTPFRIISLEPESVEDILENIRVVGEFGERKKEAVRVVRELKNRLDRIKRKIATPRLGEARNDKKPKVLVIEWLDPIMVAGHWVPEMVEKAGGRVLVIKPGERSRQVSSEELKGLREVDILIFAPCGFDIQRTIKEVGLIKKIIRGIRGVKGVYLVDGNSYMTRPGPRIIDGIEILAEIIHPEIFPRKYTKKDWVEFR